MRNLLVMIGVVGLSFVYLWFSPMFVPQQYALVLNFIVVPVVLGVLAALMLVGRLPIKLVLLLIIPVAHVVGFGEDPAKPGLENLLAVVELIALCIGCVAAHLFTRKKASPQDPQLRPEP